MKFNETTDGFWIDVKYLDFLIKAFQFESFINSRERAELYLYNIPKLRDAIVKMMNEDSEIERLLLISENRQLLNVPEKERAKWIKPYEVRKKKKNKTLFAKLNKPWED